MLLKSTRLFFVIAPIMVEAYLQRRMVNLTFLAGVLNVNKRSLTPIMHRLMQVGCLKSQTGGTTPGFIFAKDPKTISLAEIIAHLEGHKGMESCWELFPDATHLIKDGHTCLLCRMMGQLVQDAESQYLNVTLHDLYEDSDIEKIKTLLG